MLDYIIKKLKNVFEYVKKRTPIWSTFALFSFILYFLLIRLLKFLLVFFEATEYDELLRDWLSEEPLVSRLIIISALYLCLCAVYRISTYYLRKRRKIWSVLIQKSVHSVSFALSVFTIISMSWITGHWDQPAVVNFVNKLDTIFHSHYAYAIEFTLTIPLSMFFHALIKLVRNKKLISLGKKAGIFAVHDNGDNYEVKECNDFVAEVARDNREMNIICATGQNTFAKEGTPLHKELRKLKRVKILMAFPYSDEVKQRARNIGMTESDYCSQVIDSIKYLHATPANCIIELKMYKQYPFWRLIHVGFMILLQQYESAKLIKESPLYAFGRDYISETFYDRLLEIFWRSWHDPSNGIYNFSTGKIKFPNEDMEIDLKPIP